MSCQITRSIGAYLLGAVDYPEWIEIDRHVRHCEVCRSEIVQLAGLPGLIGRLPLDEVIGGDVPNAPVEHEPKRRWTGDRRRSPLMAVAVAVVAIVGIFAGIQLSRSGASAGTATSTFSTAFALAGNNPAAHVRGGASLTAQEWGTEIWIQVQGVPPGTQCTLVVHGRDGRTVVSGRWMSESTKAFWVPASTPLPRTDIASLDVVTPTHTLVTLTPGSGQVR